MAEDNGHEPATTEPELTEAQRLAQSRYVQACLKLTNWGAVLTGRLVGNLGEATEPRAIGWRQLFDMHLLLRAEISAFTNLLILKGVLTEAEVQEAIGMEAEQLSIGFEKAFPGIRSLPLPNGLQIVDKKAWAKTTEGWPQ